MHTLGVLLFSAAVLVVSGRHKREWELVDLKKISRELLPPFYNYELSACSRGVGFYRDPNDCHQYIRCVDDYSSGNRLSIFVGRCRPGLVFDENISSCNWPDLAAPCNDGPERFKDNLAGRFKPVQQENAIPGGISSSGSQNKQPERKQKPNDSNKQFVQESEASVFQETEIQGQFQESLESSQIEKDRQQQIPQNSKYPKDRVQVSQSQQDYVRRQWPKPVNQRQQVQEPARKPQGKPAQRPQQVREPVVQEQFEQVREPVVQEQFEQVREPVVQEQFEQVREPVIQEQFEQDPNPVTQQPEQIREPVIKQPERIREPVIKEQEKIREPVIKEQERIREPIIKQPERIREPVIKEQERIREPVIKEQERIREPVIKQQEKVREPVIKQPERIREPVIKQPERIREPVIQQSDQIQEQEIQQHNQEPVIQVKDKFEQVQNPVAQQTEQIRQPVVEQQFEPIQEPAIQEKEEIREPVIEESGKFPHDQSIWQESDQQEKINQQSIKNQHPAFEESQQQKIQRPSNVNSQIKETVQSSGFQEIADEEIRQIPTSSVKKPLQQQKQPTTQANRWFQSNQSHRPTSSSGLAGSSRRRPVRPLPTSLEDPILCRREGFFSHPRDCTRFVRCVRTEQKSFSVHFFQCANDLVFDEGVNHCVYSEGNTCASRRSKRQVVGETLECNGEGFFRHPRDCRSFYRCVKGASGMYDTHLFSCPDALVFDEEYATCNWPDKAAPCDTRRQFSRTTRAPEVTRRPVRPNRAPAAIRAPVRPIQRTSTRPKSDYFDTNSNPFTESRERSTPRPRYTTQSPSRDRQVCNSPGFFRHDKDCTKFYKCVQNGNYFVRYELSCPNNFAYDETTTRCVSQKYSNACTRRYTPYPPRQDDEESPQTTEAVSSSSQPPSESSDEIKCEKEGYFRNPEDCNLFYRCVDFSHEGQEFVKYDFSCPEGLVFNEQSSVCTWPDPTKPCEGRAGTGGGDRETGQDEANETDNELSSEIPQETTTTRRPTSTRRPTTGSGRRSTTPSTTTQVTSSPEEASPRPEEDSEQPDESDSESGCNQEGFFRNPEDCNKFYRCVDFSGAGQEYVRYDFACAEGLVFDEANSVCNWPSASAPCESSTGGDTDEDGSNRPDSTSTRRPTQGGRSTTTGRTRSTTQISSTQRGRGSTTSRPRSTVTVSTTLRTTQSARGSTTSRPRQSTTRSNDRTTPSPTTEESDDSSNQNDGECKEAGFFRNPDDCNKFYRCVDYNGNEDEFVKYDFACPEGLTFDEKNSVCNWPDASEPCEGGSEDKDDSTTNINEVPTSSTTQRSTTQRSTTQRSTTQRSTTQRSTTQRSTTQRSTTQRSTTQRSTTQRTTTQRPTTQRTTTQRSTTQRTTTQRSTTQRRTPIQTTTTPSQSTASTENESRLTTTTGDSENKRSTSESSTDNTGKDENTGNEECREAGFFRNPDDCGKFYRCVDFNGDGQEFVRYDFDCPEGLTFDEANSVCNWPEQSAPCDGSSTDGNRNTSVTTPASQTSQTGSSTTPQEIVSTTKSDDSSSTTAGDSSECIEEGFFRNRDDCKKFYRCIDETGSGQQFTRYDFQCPEGLIFDDQNKKCDFPSDTLSCDDSESTTAGVQTTTSSATSAPGECTEEGYFRNPNDCSQYYRCIDEGDGNFIREDFSCAEDEVFDEEMRYCNRKDLAAPCDGISTSAPGTTQTDESTSTSRTDCTESGFFRCPDDCNKFYRCVEEDGNSGNYIRYNFTCPEGLIFDERNKKCDFPSAELTCDDGTSTSGSTQSESTTTITSTTLSSSTTDSTTTGDSATCTEEGFFRNPEDCSKYYRCLDEGDGTFMREDFSCAEDEVFDEEMRYCNRKDLAPPCDESSTSPQTQGTTQSDESTTSATDSSSSECSEPGFFRCPDDCNKFFRCVEDENNGGLIRYNFTCPEGLIFDESNKRCDFPSAELTCDSGSSTTSSGSDATTASSGATSSTECTEEGFFRNPNDCNKYYRCLDEGDGTLTREDFSCAEDEVFDEEMRYCNRKDLAPPCDQTTTEPGSSTTQRSTSVTEAGSSAQTDSSDGTTQSNESTTANPTDSTTRSGEQSGDCQEEGFHVDPQDCSKFHRCVDFEGNGQSYTRYDFECPEGLVFDETNDVCNWPSSVPNCESSGRDNSSTTVSENTSTTDESSTQATDSASTTTSTGSSPTPNEVTTSSSDGTTSDTTSSGPSGDIDCTEEGFFRNPDDCTKFYRCVDFAGTGESYVRYDFECPQDLVYDEVNKVCNWPSMTPACESGSRNDSSSTTVGDDSTTTDGSSTDRGTTTTSASTIASDTTTIASDTTTIASDTTTRSPSTDSTTASEGDFQCEEEGFFRDANNCKKYYECKRDEDSGELVKIDCECPDGHIFDMDGWYCNVEELSPPCDDGSFRCQEEGFFRDPEDCTRYYQCSRPENGETGFTSERFECTDGNVFDEAGRYCNAPELSEPCENSTNSTGTTQSPTSSSATSESEQTTPSESSSTTSGADQTGSTTSSSDDQCTEEGFFRNSEDCTKYHQCSRNGDSGEWERTDFSCPDGRVFDEGSNYCNDPELSEQPCDNGQTTDGETTAQGGTTTISSSSTTTSPTTSGDRNRNAGGDIECTEVGFFRHPDDCNKFYRCVDFSGTGESYVRYDFDCPEGLHFDEVNSVCNWPTMTPRCTSGSF